jgi:hypothetical protein
MNGETDQGPTRPARREGSELLSPRHPPETADEAEGSSDRDTSLLADRPPHHDAR